MEKKNIYIYTIIGRGERLREKGEKKKISNRSEGVSPPFSSLTFTEPFNLASVIKIKLLSFLLFIIIIF